MAIESYARIVREQIADAYGITDDLSQELVNTLCNLHFFSEKGRRQNLGGLTDLQSIYPHKGEAALMSLYTDHMDHVSFALAHAPELIEKLRAIRSGSSFEYFETFTLDLLKYRITDAQNKSGMRRALERKVKTPIELSGLAKRFDVPFRLSAV